MKTSLNESKNNFKNNQVKQVTNYYFTNIFENIQMFIMKTIQIIIKLIKNIKPLLFLGPSGVGKDTIINRLIETYPNVFYKLASYTTRPKRPGEKEGIDYFFINEEEFHKMEKEEKLFGIKKYNNNYYASNKGLLKELINKNDRIIILNYNIETVYSIKNEIDFNCVAIMPPQEDELKKRLIRRGTKPEEIDKRMKNSIEEIKLINEANDIINYRVVNDDIDICLNKLMEYIKASYPQFFVNKA